MSQDIRQYEGTEECKLKLRALVGEEWDRNISLHIGRESVRLTETQALDLISVIAKRLKCKERNFTATGVGDTKIVKPDGEITIDSEDF